MSYIYKIISFLLLTVLFIGCGENDKNNGNEPKADSKEYSYSRFCDTQERAIFKNIKAPAFTSASSVSIYEGIKDVTTITATANNGGAVSYVICGRGKAFFDIDPSSGKMTFNAGTTSNYSSRSSYKIVVKAIDSNDSRVTSQIFTINILAIVKPNIQNVADQNFTVNKEITSIEFENNGGEITACNVPSSLSPLPTGLSLTLSATNKCVVSGTPIKLSSSLTEYTITASNTAGESNATIKIAVSRLAPILSDNKNSIFSGQSVGESYIVGLSSEDWTFSNTGGAITKCELIELIPWLTVSNSDCTITGTPTNSVAGWYTLRAWNNDVSNNLLVYIHAKQNNLSLVSVEGLNLRVGETMTPIVFNNVLYCGLSNSSPVLPNGLTITADKTNKKCTIAGTPTAIQDATTYTVRATDAIKGGEATVIITIKNPPKIADIAGEQSITAGTTITPIKFINTGGNATSCSSNPSLPTGLNIVSDGTTCEINGKAPSSTVPSAEYTITATGDDGEDSASISIAIITE